MFRHEATMLLVGEMDVVVVNHVFRNGNKFADWLANVAMNGVADGRQSMFELQMFGEQYVTVPVRNVEPIPEVVPFVVPVSGRSGRPRRGAAIEADRRRRAMQESRLI